MLSLVFVICAGLVIVLRAWEIQGNPLLVVVVGTTYIDFNCLDFFFRITGVANNFCLLK